MVVSKKGNCLCNRADDIQFPYKYTITQHAGICYLGELVGMVGSMETKAPSGSTIMMAVFLSWKEE